VSEGEDIMSDVKNIWVIAETEAAVNELVSAARSYTDDVTLVYGGPADEAKGATFTRCRPSAVSFRKVRFIRVKIILFRSGN